ncbi:MAG: glucose-6-phosphate isomerase [Bryobacteraceae bacterium]|jgi:glucose-6-phosphate isomerase
MKIQFDERNLLAGAVGRANGIARGEFDRSQPKALEALRSFRRLSEADRYGFPHLPFQKKAIQAIRQYAGSVHGGYDTVCLVGIGGSALGAWALDCGIRGPHPVQGAYTPEHPRLVILDNIDPSFTAAALASMDPGRTLAVAIAKSGGTAETVATFLIVRDWLERALGSGASSRIVAVTTEGKGDLFVLAQREGWRVFAIPENVGGRFSVLSPVGLLPAALIGIDIAKLTRGAAAMTRCCWWEDLEQNVALRAALCHWLIWTRKDKPIQVAFAYSNHLWGTAFWFRQLWAESLGKARTRAGKTAHVGQTPVAALGATDQHSQVQLYIEGPNDKAFTFWAVDRFASPGKIPAQRLGLPAFDALAGKSLAKLFDAERRATAAALTENGRPNCEVTLGRVDEEHLGAFLQMMEFQTAFMGELLNVNAFDQEGVELGKKLTYGLMGRKGFEGYRARFDAYEKKRSA